MGDKWMRLWQPKLDEELEGVRRGYYNAPLGDEGRKEAYKAVYLRFADRVVRSREREQKREVHDRG